MNNWYIEVYLQKAKEAHRKVLCPGREQPHSESQGMEPPPPKLLYLYLTSNVVLKEKTVFKYGFTHYSKFSYSIPVRHTLLSRFHKGGWGRRENGRLNGTSKVRGSRRKGEKERAWLTELLSVHQASVQALANTWLSLFAFQLPFEEDLENWAADIYDHNHALWYYFLRVCSMFNRTEKAQITLR